MRIMTDLQLPTPLVTVDWLAEHHHQAEVVVLDASWHLPTTERDGRTEFLQRRMPGAQFFDYDGAIRDHDNPLPRMMPRRGPVRPRGQRLGHQ